VKYFADDMLLLFFLVFLQSYFSPSTLLSTVVGFGKSNDPKKSQQLPNQNMQTLPSCALHIYDLNNQVKTEHLISFLAPFNGEYILQVC
jgi:hypothetical protein